MNNSENNILNNSENAFCINIQQSSCKYFDNDFCGLAFLTRPTLFERDSAPISNLWKKFNGRVKLNGAQLNLFSGDWKKVLWHICGGTEKKKKKFHIWKNWNVWFFEFVFPLVRLSSHLISVIKNNLCLSPNWNESLKASLHLGLHSWTDVRTLWLFYLVLF